MEETKQESKTRVEVKSKTGNIYENSEYEGKQDFKEEELDVGID